jgi:hypothetical protein
MRTVTAKYTMDGEVDAFWALFFDEEVNRRLYLDKLGFHEFEVLEKSPEKRVIRVVPKLDVPGPLKKLLGDRFAYEEHGTFDKQKSIWRWKTIPNTLRDKMTNEGTVVVEAAEAGKCIRRDEAKVEAKVFGLGSLIEGTVEKEVQAAWKKAADFFNAELKKSA